MKTNYPLGFSVCLLVALSSTTLDGADAPTAPRKKAALETKGLKEGTKKLLKLAPIQSPEETLRGLGVRDGFTVEQMAAEPMVIDPVDFAWGPGGKFWVVEMFDYPSGMDGRGKPGGRVRYLEDTDSDGRYDKSTIFVDGLDFPNSVMPWRKGILVTCAPDILYLEDTDGDGKADLRRAMFVGFSECNEQHRVNHMRWGLDNWVYLANGDGGAGELGAVKSPATGKAIDIHGRDLRLRPDHGMLDAATGRAQFGRARDDWGNWFGCNNGNPGWHYATADHYMRRNPYLATPPGRVNLTSGRKAYPRGRVISYRGSIQGNHMLEKGQPGGFTSLGGLMLYRDELFGPGFTGNLFVSDSVFNIIHRLVLSPKGTTFAGKRAEGEERSEFMAAEDPWFRNTTLRTGPDGAIWVAAMYRVSIEHPQWIDDDVEETLDLRLGDDKGRIYRIFPKDRPPRPIPRLDSLGTLELVEALDSPSGWQRDTAQQMLIWREDKAAVKPLEGMAAGAKRPLGRLHALCTLDGLNSLTAKILLKALSDPHPGVRRHAARLSEQLMDSRPDVGENVAALVGDADDQVRLQVAYSLGEWHDARAGKALARLAMRQPDSYLMAAIMSSAPVHIESMIASLKEDSQLLTGRGEFVGRLRQLARDMQEGVEDDADSDALGERAMELAAESDLNIETSNELKAVLKKFEPVMKMAGDPARGKEIFVDATCSICHRLDGVGEDLAPPLEGLMDRTAGVLLPAIIDPNRSVKLRYVEYTIVTTDGLMISGMPLDESSNSVILADVAGKRHTILRRKIEEAVRNDRSFMPEGLEGKLSLGQMADLMAFIQQASAPPLKKVEGNHPTLVTAGQDGSLRLPAWKSEIYGRSGIGMNLEQNCLAWMSATDDRAVWMVEVPASGRYSMWLKWAQIDELAGNRFAVEVEGTAKSITGKLPSTGSWYNYRDHSFGTLDLDAGRQRIVLRPDGPVKKELADVREIRLAPLNR